MGKELKKRQRRLQQRRDNYDTYYEDDPSRKRPGSMNLKKRVSAAGAKVGRRR